MTKLYTPEYESALLRGVEESRPWDIADEIGKFATQNARMLDIGCGTALKIIPLADKFEEIIGVEPSPGMRQRAEENISTAGVTNMRIVDGTAEELPFPDQTFDLVTCMLAPDDPNEILRVLQPSGRAVIEKIGEQDKINLKLCFDDDEEGPRGQLMELENGERARLYEREYGRRFREVSVQQGFWNTYYKIEGLKLLFEHTSTIRNFDADRDKSALDKIEQNFLTPKGIKATQHRILVTAFK